MEKFYLLYVFIFVFFAFFIFLIGYQRKVSGRIRKYGIKTQGVIIKNYESTEKRMPNVGGTLGGNINYPVIRFTIEDGSEITGEPFTGFISQHEVQVPSYINIIYNGKQPAEFIIDPD
jgi:hypothetical protein